MIVHDNDEVIRMKVADSKSGGTNDYRDLINKPSINGETLETNYNEIDPTVPSWAKTDAKPVYTPEEVGALSEDAEMSFSDVKALWDRIFQS